MDVIRHKLAFPSLIPWPGTCRALPLYPLPEADLADAIQAAKTRFAARGARPGGSIFALEVWVQTLARAIGGEVDEFRDTLPIEVGHLWHAWLEQVQGLADREADELQEELRKRVCDVASIHYDGAAAYAAEEGPGGFYGLPLAGLTRGQLLYYWNVRAAFGEWFGPGVTKRPTRQWLKQKTPHRD